MRFIHGPLQEKYTSRKGQPASTHQEGRNTEHYTAQLNMLLEALRLATAPAMGRYNSPRPSGRWTPLHYTAALLCTTANTAGKNPVVPKN
jgi:hypothetical protein